MLDIDDSDCPQCNSAFIADELARLNFDIAPPNEVPFLDEGCLKEQGVAYTHYYWSRKSEAERRLSGVRLQLNCHKLPFDTVSRAGLWQIMKHLWCPTRFLSIVT